MGKLHRIRKAFHRITSQEGILLGRHSLAGYTSIGIGKRQTGSVYILCGGNANTYRKFVEKLIREYNEGGVAHSDKISTKE